MRASYVLPLKWQEPDEAATAELAAYLKILAGVVDDVVVVDGSPEPLWSAHAREWGMLVRHLRPDLRWDFPNGKVSGVTTGVVAARHEAVVLADDDVRYDPRAVRRVVALLDHADLVRPQNVFTVPGDTLPWHARWDTARSLLNRAWSADYPGTFGLRRSTFLRMGGYDGAVLFENLELIRTVRAAGGTELRPLDLYVPRRPPEASRFWDQRRRQAYDDFAQPGRLLLELAILPGTGWALLRRPPALLGGAAALVGAAQVGRIKAGGRRWYPATTPLMAPLWALERGVCVWLALDLRVRRGGVRYAGRRLRVAAHSSRKLRRRQRDGSVAVRELLAYLGAETDGTVGPVAERLEPGGPASAEGDGPPASGNLGAVRGPQLEVAADDQGTVLVGGDRYRRVPRLAGVVPALVHVRRPAP